uniref:Uncharacterized protein n=1 Tax=Vespula pensylvanica TaxID=30213 RepID=A0A834P1K1_VESPE|nr:hypothetical protein H0235_007573 [Vespula pensylvanica]
MPALHISWSANCSAFLEVLHMSQPSSIWHSRVFEYVLAITNHSLRLSKNRYSIPPAQWKYIGDSIGVPEETKVKFLAGCHLMVLFMRALWVGAVC